MEEDYNKVFTFLVADIEYLHHIGKKYFDCAKKLFEEDNPQESLHPFCLLSTTAAELFLKVIISAEICMNIKDLEKDEECIKIIVGDELKSAGHNIKKLIEKSGIKKDFNISQLEEVSNGFVNDYRFIDNDNKPVFIKDSESIRFGALAKKQDLALTVQFHFSPQIVKFLEELSHFSHSKLNEAENIYKSN